MKAQKRIRKCVWLLKVSQQQQLDNCKKSVFFFIFSPLYLAQGVNWQKSFATTAAAWKEKISLLRAIFVPEGWKDQIFFGLCWHVARSLRIWSLSQRSLWGADKASSEFRREGSSFTASTATASTAVANEINNLQEDVKRPFEGLEGRYVLLMRKVCSVHSGRWQP